jgi:hypothetical protein
MKNAKRKGLPLSEREQSLIAAVRKVTKRPAINEPHKRHGFVAMNLELAREHSKLVVPTQVLLVLGLACPVALSLAMSITGLTTFPEVAPGMETTIWLVADREAVARLYETLWGGVESTVSTLREGPAPLVLFVANGGSSAVAGLLDSGPVEAVTP